MTVESIFAAWNRCRKLLVPAMTDEYDEGELINELILGRAQVWPGENAAFVTQLVNTDGARFLHVLLGGGDIREMLAMHFGLAAWGRAMGAEWASINGRKGWARALARFGFEPHGDELWKAL